MPKRRIWGWQNPASLHPHLTLHLRMSQHTFVHLFACSEFNTCDNLQKMSRLVLLKQYLWLKAGKIMKLEKCFFHSSFSVSFLHFEADFPWVLPRGFPAHWWLSSCPVLKAHVSYAPFMVLFSACGEENSHRLVWAFAIPQLFYKHQLRAHRKQDG